MIAKKNRASGLAAVVATTAASLLGFAGCSTNEPPLFNPRQVQSSERLRASENLAERLPPLPTTMSSSDFVDSSGRPRDRGPTTRPDFSIDSPTTRPTVRRISLQDLLHLAAVNSLDVKVAGFQPAIDANRIAEAQAHFDPVFFWKPQYTYTDVVAPSANDPLLETSLKQRTQYKAVNSQEGLKMNLPWGGDITLSEQNSASDRRITGQPVNYVNPFYQNELMVQINQPLLQNFGNDINRARIDIAADTHKISLLDFRLALEKNLADIEEAYWQLAQADRQINVQETLLARTWDMANTLYIRLNQGVSNVEVAQANGELEARHQQLATLRATAVKLSNKIKGLVNDPDMPVSTSVLLLPADPPLDQPISVDVSEQIQQGLENRAELAQQQLRIDSAAITRRAAKNNELPTLNLTGTIGTIGVGSNFGSAFTDQGKFHLFDFALGFELDIPLGNNEARAIYQRTLLQQLQAVTQYKRLVEQVTQDVKDACIDVKANWEELRASRNTRYARSVALSTFEDRFREGVDPMTPPLVQTRLQLQSQLSDAERSEAEASARYNIAISVLERAKGTILRYNNIIMQEEPHPYGARGRKGYGQGM